MSAGSSPPLLASVDAATLQNIYGAETTRQIATYLNTFTAEGGDAFVRPVPRIVKHDGTSLLLVQCPLSLDAASSRRSGGSPSTSSLSLGVLFLPGFPLSSPVCALMPAAGYSLMLQRATHPCISQSSGIVRLEQVPGAQDAVGTPRRCPSLFDILFSVTSVVNQCPGITVPKADSTSPSIIPVASPTRTPQQQQQQYKDPSACLLPRTDAPAASVEAMAASVEPSQRFLAEEALRRLSLLADEYLCQRETYLGKMRAIAESREALVRVNAAECARKAALVESMSTYEANMSVFSSMATLHKHLPGDAVELLVATDERSEQLLSFLAEVYACDDVLDLLEQRLQQRTVAFDDYLRQVNQAARKQFIARFMAKKTYSAMTGERSLERLVHAFPQVDVSLVAEVLRESHMDVTTANARLREMVVPSVSNTSASAPPSAVPK